tara:strand:+ start:1635 stop:2162 length:528 start_codon:yes stop_codon:yes gene_type:complete
MFNFLEIQPGDLIKVLVNIDEVEDELYATVEEHMNDYIVVRYFNETSMIFKGGYVHVLEDDVNVIREESICEHFSNSDTIFTCINIEDKMYIITSDKDSDLDSVIHDDSSSDTGCSSFIVSDTDVDGDIALPPDHAIIDKAWNEWQPTSAGSLRFKETVDRIEEHARILMDNHNF